MKNTLSFLSSIFFLVGMPSLYAQLRIEQIQNMQAPPRIYPAKKIQATLSIDGKDDEKAWKDAPWTASFIDIEGHKKPLPSQETKIKMLWDEENLYIYARLEEPHVWGTLHKRDTIIYHDNDFEIFIKPTDHHPYYFEIEVNTLNTIMDLLMPKAYSLGGTAMMHWDVQHLRSAVHIEGTLNNPTDNDKYWTVEMAIPFSSLSPFGKQATPQDNSFWKINFSRVQWQHELVGGSYQRKRKQNRLLPEDNWVWSPIGVINMHHPERWGYVQFVDKEEHIASPPNQQLEKIAWNIFYLQQLHKKQTGHFTDRIEDLPAFASVLEKDTTDVQVSFVLNPAKSFYRVMIKNIKQKSAVSLDSFGNYHIEP
ncbi:carbohydrate-binding family 9-like protein [Sphingobacterium suaedae]|uniref:Carbohydrate-binding family 9-like protein n=1 Tax=Sphingobacterium suaedae TaxID=1686402 RepID=A0ABW5KMA2_9SPHI